MPALNLNGILSSQEEFSDMGRRRGQRSGNLTEKSGSWLLRWYEDSKTIAGVKVRHRESMVIAKATGPDKVTRRQAERIAWDRVLSRLDAQVMRPAALITVQQFVQLRFIPDHVEMSLKAGGKTHYEYCLRHIMPVFGAEKLRDVSRMMIQDFLNAKRKKLSPQTVQHLKNALSAVFRHAKRCEMWSGDLPTEGLITPRIDSAEKRALTLEQATRLVSCMHGQYSVLAALLISTGLRIGEAAGLRWSRLDFAAGLIMISESWSREHGYQEVKTKKSVRYLPLPEALAAPLAALRGSAADDAPVFITEHGNPIDKRTTASSILKPAAKRAQVPWASWHTLRHTHATMTDDKLTEAERMKILGHSSAAMTMRYTHPQMERVRVAVDGIAARVAPKEGTVQ